mgnify:CR=1
MNNGKLEKRWHVVCARCGDWDIPGGDKQRAIATLIESGWQEIGYKWVCKRCVEKEVAA